MSLKYKSIKNNTHKPIWYYCISKYNCNNIKILYTITNVIPNVHDTRESVPHNIQFQQMYMLLKEVFTSL